jgi:hypothetical protein
VQTPEFTLEISMNRQAKEEMWKARVALWRESGLSQRAFAQKHGHPVRQVGYWVRRLAENVAPAPLLPVAIKQVTAAPALVLRSPQGWAMEVPAGTPVSWLAELLRSL